MASRAYYTPIAGSRDLVTSGFGDDVALARIENVPARAGSFATSPGVAWHRSAYKGEWLGAASKVLSAAGGFLFDCLPRLFGAEEQAAYLHFWRLSHGAGRNFCRVGKGELTARLRVSERHLNRLLDALVRKGAVRPLHRDNRGTLYRVREPGEMREWSEADSGRWRRAAAGLAARVARERSRGGNGERGKS